jgi:AcrR family transcriptional regulator
VDSRVERSVPRLGSASTMPQASLETSTQAVYDLFVPSPDDTPTRLVLAAERLFADGEEATSLRAIARAAHANAAAVHYHFGGRDELVAAVLRRQLGALNQRRLHALETIVATDAPPPLDVLLTASLRPDLELLAKLRKHRVGVARFLGRAHTLPSAAVATVLGEQFDAFAGRVVPMLHASLPGVTASELRLRLGLVMSAVAALFATAADATGSGPFGTNDVSEQVTRLVAFAAAGMSAPMPALAGRHAAEGKRKKRAGRGGN